MPLSLRTPDLVLHVKWFVDESELVDHPLALPEILFACFMVAVGVWVFINLDRLPPVRAINHNLDTRLLRWRQLVPLVVRISTSLMVFININHGYLLAPNVESDNSTVSLVITVLFSAAAIMVGIGYLTRIGAGLLLGTYFLVVFKANSWVDVADHFEYIGVAGYLWYRGPGRISLDGYLGIGRPIPPEHLNRALDVYRISVGFGLVILGLSEKLMNVAASQQFLDRFGWNIMAPLGIGDQLFIISAGAIEVVIGLALLLNLAPRVVTAIVLATMSLTAALLGPEEIYGHIFAVGIVLAIWVNDRVVLQPAADVYSQTSNRHLSGLEAARVRLQGALESVIGTSSPLPQPATPHQHDVAHPDETYNLRLASPQPHSPPYQWNPDQWDPDSVCLGRVVGMLELSYGRDHRITDLLVEHLAGFDPDQLVSIITQHSTLDDLLYWLGNPAPDQYSGHGYRNGTQPDGA